MSRTAVAPILFAAGEAITCPRLEHTCAGCRQPIPAGTAHTVVRLRGGIYDRRHVRDACGEAPERGRVPLVVLPGGGLGREDGR